MKSRNSQTRGARNGWAGFISMWGGATFAGLLGGAAAGLAECVYLIEARGTGKEYWLLPYAWIAYGGLGAVVGLAAGAAALGAGRIVRRHPDPGYLNGAALSTAAALTLLLVARAVYRRDLRLGAELTLLEECVAGVAALACGLIPGILLSIASRLRGFGWLASPRTNMAAAGLGLLALATFAWAASESPAKHRPPPARKASMKGRTNVLLVVIDTLRADRLPAYGYKGIETPALNAFARDAVQFNQAIAQASWTRPSVGSILTGMYPTTHGAVTKDAPLLNSVPTLGSRFHDADYYSAGMVTNLNIGQEFGFGRGFDEYTFLETQRHLWATESSAQLWIYDVANRFRKKYIQPGVDVRDYYQPAETVADRAIAWIDSAKLTTYFYFVHFMDPHDPYMVHPFEKREGYAQLDFVNLGAEMSDKLHDAYLGEITYTDEHLGRLFEHLRSEELYDDMLIVVAADHGEEFFDHGGWWHGRTLFEEQIHVPLFVKLPGNALGGTKVDYPVRLIDVAPTICELAQVPASGMEGAALFADGKPVDPGLEYVYSEENFEDNVLESTRGAEWKLIKAGPGNPRKLPLESVYNLAQDPGEARNLEAGEQARKAEMAIWMAAVRDKSLEASRLFHEMAAANTKDHPDEEAMRRAAEKLRALGYID